MCRNIKFNVKNSSFTLKSYVFNVLLCLILLLIAMFPCIIRGKNTFIVDLGGSYSLIALCNSILFFMYYSLEEDVFFYIVSLGFFTVFVQSITFKILCIFYQKVYINNINVLETVIIPFVFMMALIKTKKLEKVDETKSVKYLYISSILCIIISIIETKLIIPAISTDYIYRYMTIFFYIINIIISLEVIYFLVCQYRNKKQVFSLIFMLAFILNIFRRVFLVYIYIKKCNYVAVNYFNEFIYIIPMLGIGVQFFINDKKLNIKMNECETLQRKLTEMSDNMLDIMITIDKEGKILYVSQSYCNLVGGIYKDHKRKFIIKNIHPMDRNRVMNMVKQGIRNKKSVKAEFRFKRAGGGYVWVESVCNFIFNINGEVEKLIVNMRDINRRHNVEEKLIKSENKYRNFFEISPDYIYTLNAETYKILDKNLAIIEDFGGEGLISMESLEEEAFYSNVKCKLEKAEIVKGIHRSIKNKKGDIVDLEINYAPIMENDKLTKVLCLARNITERNKMIELKLKNEENEKRLTEVKEFDKIKTEFFANISHELRTPINVIFSALQVVEIIDEKSNLDNKNHKNYIKVMRQNCYRLLRLVNNLIDITKIDAGYLNLSMVNYDIVKVVEDITLSVVVYAENKGINIIFDTETEEKYIACDPDKIERIVINLLSNAIKFTERGGEIFVCIKERKGNVIISVKDSGSGIPKDKLDIIFERFRQVDKSLAREHEGSGIGLSLVKSLVEMHKGRIYAISEENKGSEFIVELPDITLADEEIGCMGNRMLSQDKVEKINIEFSDIYDIY